MAGDGHHGAIKHDPAIDRWYTMRENQYLNFRLTKRAARTSILLMLVIPGVLGWVAYKQDMKWDWRAKRKGQSLLASQESA